MNKPRSRKPRPQPTPVQRALGLLVRREHSRKELARKLTARGVETEDAIAAVERLASEGWQDDTRFACSLVRGVRCRGMARSISGRNWRPTDWTARRLPLLWKPSKVIGPRSPAAWSFAVLAMLVRPTWPSGAKPPTCWPGAASMATASALPHASTWTTEAGGGDGSTAMRSRPASHRRYDMPARAGAIPSGPLCRAGHHPSAQAGRAEAGALPSGHGPCSATLSGLEFRPCRAAQARSRSGSVRPPATAR